ncbi:MAG TPA: energy-coupling factor transporter transmembrane component T [Miltoncostaeaceae bacterium]|nr:energy-coupling factor transporter transmembrane component T [Miltoncostaeaceae bacterium]
MRGGAAPGPVLLLGAGAVTLAFASDHPLVLLAAAAGAVLLFMAAPVRSPIYPTAAAIAAVTIVVLNPFVQGNGEHIVVQGPEIPILDTQVTVEELVAGLAIGLRAVAVTLVIGAVLAHADPDRLQSAIARVLPRSALASALSARMLPTLERDARALAESARLRGLALEAGSRLERARTAAGLALPLVGSSLERALDVAEAMAARGYGAARRTRLPEPPLRRREVVVLGAGVAVLAVGVAAAVLGLGDYSFYPTLDAPADGGAVAAAAVALAGMAVASAALWRR